MAFDVDLEKKKKIWLCNRTELQLARLYFLLVKESIFPIKFKKHNSLNKIT